MSEDTTEKLQENTLYRKHRPQKFSDVAGQETILRVLKGSLARHKVAHAYLFAGPRGTGKTTVARIIAKTLNCQNANEGEACGECANCVAFSRKASLDLIEIDAASNRGIDEIRALKEKIGLAPAMGKYKVYIVDEVHMLTKEAFNALLKTLEEPPAHAIFILATTELHKVPDTIKSRCQTFAFRRASVALITERLKKITAVEGRIVDDASLITIANHSDGCFRDSESLLGQVLAITDGDIKLEDTENILGTVGFRQIQEFVAAVLAKQADKVLKILGEVMEEGASLRRFADDVTRYLRALASQAVAGRHSEEFDVETENELKQQAQKTPAQQVVRLLRLFLRAKAEMADSLYEEMPLEIAVYEWCDTSLSQPAAPKAVATSQGQPLGNSIKTPEAPKTTPAPMPTTSTTPANKAHNYANISFRKEETKSVESDNKELYEKVLSHWEEFLEKTSSLNPLLISTLKDSLPSAVRGATVYLVTDFSLYKERTNDNKVRQSLEELFSQICGEKILIRVVMRAEAQSMNLPVVDKKTISEAVIKKEPEVSVTSAPTDITSDALSILGGELVGN